MLINGFEVDESRVFSPVYDNMYPIKFLSDLVYNKIGLLIENPFDTRVHPDLTHDYKEEDLAEMKQNMARKSKGKVYANVVEKIIDSIQKL